MEGKMKSVSGGSSAMDNINRVRQLEKDLETKTQQISRLEAEMKNSKTGTGPRKGGPGPCLSRTGSVERNVEDENEALSSQLKKMATKNKRRSPSPYNRNASKEEANGEDEHIDPAEIRVQLEVSEQETE